jgi:hypothetical protein
MAAQNDVGENVEIRKLGYLHKQRLGQLLDSNDSWKGLMAQIPVSFRPVRSKEKRFNYEDIRSDSSMVIVRLSDCYLSDCHIIHHFYIFYICIMII